MTYLLLIVLVVLIGLDNVLTTIAPTRTPTITPSVVPTTTKPSVQPSIGPSVQPTVGPTISPSKMPTVVPTLAPSVTPTVVPTVQPTQPTAVPTKTPTRVPTTAPSSYVTKYNMIFASAGKGTTGSTTGTGGKATSAQFNSIRNLYQDTTGLMYVEDAGDNCIRTYNPTTDSILKNFAGVCGAADGDTKSGPATSAKLANPFGLMGDTLGNIYFPDYNNHNVKKVNSAGILSWVAGDGTTGYAGLGGQATAADIAYPHDLYLDSTGVIFVTGYFSCQVRAIATNGIVTLVAGIYSANAYSGDGGQATSAKLNSPVRIRADTTGLMYISDADNNRVRMVGNDGIISTFAGTGTSGYSGEGLAATSGKVNYPVGIWIDGTVGDIYLADSGQIRFNIILDATQTVYTYAGSGTAGGTGDGGAATSATFSEPNSWSQDTNGNMYVLDNGKGTVRVIYSIAPTVAPTLKPTLQPTVIPSIAPTIPPTLLPTISPTVLPSIAPSAAPTATPSVSILPTQSPTVVPTSSLTLGPTSVRATLSNIDVLAGTGTSDSTGTDGPAVSAAVYFPRGVWGDSLGVIYISETTGNCIRRVDTATNIIQVFAGVCASATNALIVSSGSSGDDGPATAALLNTQVGLFVSTVGVVYIADYGNSKIRSVSRSTGIMSLVAGIQSAVASSGDGGAATAAGVYGPSGVWCDTLGVVYVSSYLGNVVRAISTSNIISTFAGTGSSAASGDGGPATNANIAAPQRVLGDSTGKIYVTDETNKRVRAISVSGNIITAFIGLGTSMYKGEGVAATSQGMGKPVGLSINPDNGDFYVVSSGTNRVFVRTGSSGLIYTYVGTGTSGNTGDSGPASAALINAAEGIYFDPSNSKLYLADSGNNKLRVVFSVVPTQAPSVVPTTIAPSVTPTVLPSQAPSVPPSISPSVLPSIAPTVSPSIEPSVTPSLAPTLNPTTPTLQPSQPPTVLPTVVPTVNPSEVPSMLPTVRPTVLPSVHPTVSPSLAPSAIPTLTIAPSSQHTAANFLSYTVTNALAFAGITANGSVIAWGASGSGGDCSSVSNLLVNVSEVVSSKNAFAALKGNGEVVAWGNAGQINGWTAATNGVKVVSLVATEQAFVGVTSSGGVIAFGSGCCGGNVNQYGWAQYLTGVKSVRASAGAFCALKIDRTVYCWGSEFAGGGVSSMSRSDLTDIVSLSSTRSAFAGVTSTGNVLVWGSRKFGGMLSTSDSSRLSGSTQYVVSNSVSFAAYVGVSGFLSWGEFSDVDTASGGSIASLAHTATAFVAVRSNGSAVSWGNSNAGGGVSLLSGVSQIVGNHGAFAALTTTGLVTAWGSSDHGGDESSVSSQLVSVSSVYHTSKAFAALKTGGSVVTWGAVAGGGSSSTVAAYLTSGVRMVCANDVAFTAILENDSAVVWGHSTSVGTGGVVSGNYSMVISC